MGDLPADVYLIFGCRHRCQCSTGYSKNFSRHQRPGAMADIGVYVSLVRFYGDHGTWRLYYF